MKIGNIEITIEPNESGGHSVALIGDYSSNYGRIEGGRLSMEWEWGLTPKVVEFIKSKAKKGGAE